MSQRRLVPINVLARATAPAGSKAGDMYYNTTDGKTYVYSGSAWAAIQDTATAASGLDGFLLAGM